MTKVLRFYGIILLVTTLYPISKVTAASVGAVGGMAEEQIIELHPLEVASPARRTLLHDPVYKILKISINNMPVSKAIDDRMEESTLLSTVKDFPVTNVAQMEAFLSFIMTHRALEINNDVENVVLEKLSILSAHEDTILRSVGFYLLIRCNIYLKHEDVLTMCGKLIDADVNFYPKITFAKECAYGMSNESARSELFDRIRPYVPSALSDYYDYARVKAECKHHYTADIEHKLAIENRLRAFIQGTNDPYYKIKAKILQMGFQNFPDDIARRAAEQAFLSDVDVAGLPSGLKAKILRIFSNDYASETISEERAQEILGNVDAVLALKAALKPFEQLWGLLAKASIYANSNLSLYNPAMALEIYNQYRIVTAEIGNSYIDYSVIAKLIRLLFKGPAELQNLGTAEAILSDMCAMAERDEDPDDIGFANAIKLELYSSASDFDALELNKVLHNLYETPYAHQSQESLKRSLVQIFEGRHWNEMLLILDKLLLIYNIEYIDGELSNVLRAICEHPEFNALAAAPKYREKIEDFTTVRQTPRITEDNFPSIKAAFKRYVAFLRSNGETAKAIALVEKLLRETPVVLRGQIYDIRRYEDGSTIQYVPALSAGTWNIRSDAIKYREHMHSAGW